MKAGFVLQLASLFLLLCTTTEGFFLEYPKKTLMDFLQSLKDKKDPKKPQGHNIQHYHLHYYPPPVHVISGRSAKAPEKRELDRLYSDRLRSLGWSSNEYKYVPEPEIALPLSFDESWNAGDGWSWGQHALDKEYIHDVGHESRGLVIQVPLRQQIIIQQPHANREEKPKPNPFAMLFQKLKNIKNTIFNQGKEQCEDRVDQTTPSLNDKLKAYVIYLPSKDVKKS